LQGFVDANRNGVDDRVEGGLVSEVKTPF